MHRTDTPGQAPIRVMLVDDHAVVREGLRRLLEEHGGFEVVAEADTVADAVPRAHIFTPDVVVLDVQLPDGSGVEACRDIRSADPEVGVLILTSFDDDTALFDAIMAGANGYLLKRIRPRELVEAIGCVGAGECILDPAVTSAVLDRIRDPLAGVDPLLARLSDNELRIVELIAEGLTNREIAERVHLAEKTVKNYVSYALQKLGVSRRAEAAAYFATHTTGHEHEA